MSKKIGNTSKLEHGFTAKEFKKCIDNWITACKANGLSENTLFYYANIEYRFLYWWAVETNYSKILGTHPADVSTKEVKEFINWLREPLTERWGNQDAKPITPKTIDNHIRVNKIFFKWLMDEEFITTNPFKAITFSSKKKDRTVKVLTGESLQKIFAVLTNPENLQDFTGFRNLTMISLLLDSGMRKGELLNMTKDALDLTNLRCIVTGKTGSHYSYFSEKVKGLLLEYFNRRREEFVGDENYIWVTREGEPLQENTFNSIVQKIERESDVEFSAHRFRHTFITMMSSQVSTFELMQMVGHRNIQTTLGYYDGSPDKIQAAYQKNPSPLNSLESSVTGLKKRPKGRPRKYTK